jgi:hypothetical protein
LSSKKSEIAEAGKFVPPPTPVPPPSFVDELRQALKTTKPIIWVIVALLSSIPPFIWGAAAWLGFIFLKFKSAEAGRAQTYKAELAEYERTVGTHRQLMASLNADHDKFVSAIESHAPVKAELVARAPEVQQLF